MDFCAVETHNSGSSFGEHVGEITSQTPQMRRATAESIYTKATLDMGRWTRWALKHKRDEFINSLNHCVDDAFSTAGDDNNPKTYFGITSTGELKVVIPGETNSNGRKINNPLLVPDLTTRNYEAISAILVLRRDTHFDAAERIARFFVFFSERYRAEAKLSTIPTCLVDCANGEPRPISAILAHSHW